LPDATPLAALLPRLDGTDPGRTLHCRAAVASTLVAGLELARDGVLTLAQDVAWAPIRVHPPSHDAAASTAAAAHAEPAAAAAGS
jgi:segregation and condensation protein A